MPASMLGADRLGELARVESAGALEQPVVNVTLPDHDSVHHVARLGRQVRQSRQDEMAHGARESSSGRHARADQLLGQKGNAITETAHAFEKRWVGAAVGHEVLHLRRDLLVREATKTKHLAMGQLVQRGQPTGERVIGRPAQAHRRQDQQSGVGRDPSDVLHDVQRRTVGPLQVVDPENDQPVRSQPSQQAGRGAEHRSPVDWPWRSFDIAQGGHEGRQGRRLATQEIGDPVDAQTMGQVPHDLREQAERQLASRENHPVPVQDQSRLGPKGESRNQFADESCLADAGLAFDDHEPGLPVIGVGDHAQQAIELGVTAHHDRAAEHDHAPILHRAHRVGGHPICLG